MAIVKPLEREPLVEAAAMNSTAEAEGGHVSHVGGRDGVGHVVGPPRTQVTSSPT